MGLKREKDHKLQLGGSDCN